MYVEQWTGCGFTSKATVWHRVD